MECPICHGTGQTEESHRIICLACNGQGQIDGRDCGQCQGTGETTVVEQIVCDLCQGSGQLE